MEQRRGAALVETPIDEGMVGQRVSQRVRELPQLAAKLVRWQSRRRVQRCGKQPVVDVHALVHLARRDDEIPYTDDQQQHVEKHARQQCAEPHWPEASCYELRRQRRRNEAQLVVDVVHEVRLRGCRVRSAARLASEGGLGERHGHRAVEDSHPNLSVAGIVDVRLDVGGKGLKKTARERELRAPALPIDNVAHLLRSPSDALARSHIREGIG
mmetsp:Transcript_94285/g.282708  ORF Transcript_94285/g.282708 Transcript_94285/m.282708 type:complete len:213 (+) Transcript_94285:826-1464(+)